MAPAGGPVERLEVMWDHHMFPVRPVGRRGPFAAVPLPISAPLRHDLQAWSDEWTAVMLTALRTGSPDRDTYVPPPEEDRRAWAERGRALVVRLQGELGPGFVVGYRGTTGGEVEWPDAG